MSMEMRVAWDRLKVCLRTCPGDWMDSFLPLRGERCGRVRDDGQQGHRGRSGSGCVFAEVASDKGL